MSEEQWFEYNGERLELYHHLYNLTFLNERQVELAIAKHWLAGRSRSHGLEVGNVLGHYWPCFHAVWDLHEPKAWYQDQPYANIDILDPIQSLAMFEYEWVVSLSTIEHTAAPAEAICKVNTCAPVGLLSFPTGVVPSLDQWLEDGAPGDYSVRTLCREQNDHGGWVETLLPQVRPYGPWANAVAILEWDRR